MNILQSGVGKLYEMLHKHKRPGYNFLKFKGVLYLKHMRSGLLLKDHGLVSANLVTTIFCEDLVDNLIAEVPQFGDYKYHQSGVDASPSPAIGDTNAIIDTTGCPAPIAGTQVQSTAVIYESVVTVPYVSSLSITQHGIGNNSTWGSAILMDHHGFTAVPVVNGDSIQFTYDLTCTAGG